MSETEQKEMIEISERLGFHSIARKLRGEESEEGDEEIQSDVFESSRLPSQQGRQQVGETLRWMGCGWGDE